ncbi:hypothetical protein DFH29DRAFT_917013 [Suillus ampliporus]|nr:hypothetical protein DFH29DRAFT_917013 [Suillus ampliporus]
MEKPEAGDSEQLHETATRTFPHDVQRCYDIISSTNLKLELELEKVGLRGREDYDKDLRGWKVRAQELSSSKPQTKKLAFIGRTGAGKSTAINAILGAPVLSTRADVTCTSVQTEVIYEALPPTHWRATINFVGKKDWEKTLSIMLDDLAVYGTDTSNIGRGIHDDSAPALRALSFPPPRQDMHVLLEHESIVSTLGTERQMNGIGFDTLELQETEGNPMEPFVWHLVDSVRIYGAFDVLASGAVTLVDIPGYGDANKTRTKRTEEYLRAAEVKILGKAMRDYLIKFLRERIRADGRMESVLIVLTGTDVRINEDQLHYLDKKQWHLIQQMCQEIDRLSDILEELENSFASEMFNPMAPDGYGELMERQKRKHEIASRLKTAQAAKNTYIAHQRSARVREVFLQLYRQVYQMKPPPPLPVFCVGSTDFNQLLGARERRRAPLVFTTPEDTGIPQLRRHIHDFGCKAVLSGIKGHVRKCTSLWEEIESFFLSARQDSRLMAYENVARSLAEDLKDIVDQTRKDSGGRIDDRINELEKALLIEAEKAADRSLNTIKTLGEDYRWHSYRALMRREGEWRLVDLNEDLVQGMLDGAVSSVWHKFFTDFIRLELQSLIVVSTLSCSHDAISNHGDTAIQSIKNRAQRMATIASRINNACNLIHPWDMIDPAREQYLSAILAMQREFCGSFKDLLRDELENHYQDMASESGPGMYQRMKNRNETQFTGKNAQDLYARLVDRVMTSIRIARDKGETALDEALVRLYSSIDRSLVCVQGNDKISKVKRRNMQKFLEEECNKPLAEVTAIMDRYK